MRSSDVPRLLGLLIAGAACSHPGAKREGPAPADAAAIPHAILTADDIERANGRPLEQLLMDRFPGVTARRTGDGGISISIHGVGSFKSSNEPLYVLDGVPLPVPGGDGATLRAINPRDIESIEIVKDPVGEAAYGVRGSNGVVIIKTKTKIRN